MGRNGSFGIIQVREGWNQVVDLAAVLVVSAVMAGWFQVAKWWR